MLRTRLWMGAILIALTLGVLAVDQWLAPYFPFLLLLVLLLALGACRELVQLLGQTTRLPAGLCFAAVAASRPKTLLVALTGSTGWFR
jgi:hypothetical protein